MASAKDIHIKPITRIAANGLIRRVHYSGKVVNNSQLHLGAFLEDHLEGAMQFGPSLDKRKMMGLVQGTSWNGFIELNRLAFSDKLPRNSESRALGVAMRLIKRTYPHLKWIVSFADATQCGDGTIYRASGFILTGIKKNYQIWIAPDQAHSRFSHMSLTDNSSHVQQEKAKTISRVTATKGKHIQTSGAASMKDYIKAGFKPLPGFQLRYIYFLDATWRSRLTVPEIPFSEIDKQGARMYKGQKPDAPEA